MSSMQFAAPLQEARLLKRYQRFLADVRHPDGRRTTVHCPNTGRMTGCADPGSRVWLLPANPTSKYRFRWELVECAPGQLACIHARRANDLAREAVEQGVLPALRGYSDFSCEQAYPGGAGRADLLLRGRGRACFVEVKSITLHCGDGVGAFPDAPSIRARRHLHALTEALRLGHRAVLLFCIQHSAIHEVRPADEIDPDYGRELRRAASQGVEVLACRTHISLSGIRVTAPTAVRL